MRERRGIIALVFTLVIVVFFAGARITEAAEEEPDEIAEAMKTEILSEFDFSELDSSLREMFPGEKVTFSDIVSSLISGGIDDAGNMTAQFLKDRIAFDFLYNRKTIVYIILAALVAAVFSNFADAFQNRQISDISFYVIYMLLITLCLTAFQTAVSGLEEKMGLLTEFIRALAPAYFMAMAFASGSAAALVFYNLILFLIYMVELIIIHILLPAVNIYVMICVLGSLIEEDFLSELAGLIRKAVTWALHGLLACVAGINIIQGLLAPAVDSVKRSTLTRTAEAVPWVGDLMGGTAEILTGTVILIKNGIGMAGAVVALVICATPLLQMVITALMYKLAAALVQPVSDKRIISCIRGVSEGYELLVRILFTAGALFLITIAVTASFTS
jgi:stage III sporulation protein AE